MVQGESNLRQPVHASSPIPASENDAVDLEVLLSYARMTAGSFFLQRLLDAVQELPANIPIQAEMPEGDFWATGPNVHGHCLVYQLKEIAGGLKETLSVHSYERLMVDSPEILQCLCKFRS